MAERRVAAMVADVDRVTDAVVNDDDLELSWEELDQLRCATRRLRRAIEVRTIATSISCASCGKMFVRVPSSRRFCSEACQDAAEPATGTG